MLAVTTRPAFEERANTADTALNLAGVAHADRAQLHAKRRCYGLDRAQLGGPYGKVPKHRLVYGATSGKRGDGSRMAVMAHIGKLVLAKVAQHGQLGA